LGDIEASWTKNGSQFRLDIVIPATMRAAVVFPLGRSEHSTIHEGESLVWSGGKLQGAWRGSELSSQWITLINLARPMNKRAKSKLIT